MAQDSLTATDLFEEAVGAKLKTTENPFTNQLISLAQDPPRLDVVKKFLKEQDKWEGVPQTPQVTRQPEDYSIHLWQQKTEAIMNQLVEVGDTKTESSVLMAMGLARSLFEDLQEERRKRFVGKSISSKVLNPRPDSGVLKLLTKEEEEKANKLKEARNNQRSKSAKNAPKRWEKSWDWKKQDGKGKGRFRSNSSSSSSSYKKGTRPEPKQ